MADKELDIITTPNFNDEIEDAVDKKHTQGTDQKLDEGGANEVAVADVKDAVDKKHSQNTDTALGALTADIDSNGHIVVDLDDAISNNIFNKFIISAQNLQIISFDSFDKIDSAVAGSGVNTQNLCSVRSDTGATANSYARQNFSTQSGFSLYSGNKLLYYTYLRTTSGDGVGFLGAIRNTLLTTQTDHILTSIHAGLFYDNGVFYTSTGDGADQQLTTVTGSVSGQNWLKITYDGTSVKFYWGNTLIATHTTFTPTTGMYQQLWVSNKANAIQIYFDWNGFVRMGAT